MNQNYNLVEANNKGYKFHIYYYICNNYGHKVNQCRHRSHPARPERKFISYFKCKQSEHYVNQCRSRNEEKFVEKNVIKYGESKKKENLI